MSQGGLYRRIYTKVFVVSSISMVIVWEIVRVHIPGFTRYRKVCQVMFPMLTISVFPCGRVRKIYKHIERGFAQAWESQRMKTENVGRGILLYEYIVRSPPLQILPVPLDYVTSLSSSANDTCYPLPSYHFSPWSYMRYWPHHHSPAE